MHLVFEKIIFLGVFCLSEVGTAQIFGGGANIVYQFQIITSKVNVIKTLKQG